MGEMTAHSARATWLRQLSVSLPARWEKSESRRNNKHKKSPKKKIAKSRCTVGKEEEQKRSAPGPQI
jgi:hypothetical protein